MRWNTLLALTLAAAAYAGPIGSSENSAQTEKLLSVEDRTSNTMKQVHERRDTANTVPVFPTSDFALDLPEADAKLASKPKKTPKPVTPKTKATPKPKTTKTKAVPTPKPKTSKTKATPTPKPKTSKAKAVPTSKSKTPKTKAAPALKPSTSKTKAKPTSKTSKTKTTPTVKASKTKTRAAPTSKVPKTTVKPTLSTKTKATLTSKTSKSVAKPSTKTSPTSKTTAKPSKSTRPTHSTATPSNPACHGRRTTDGPSTACPASLTQDQINAAVDRLWNAIEEHSLNGEAGDQTAGRHLASKWFERPGNAYEKIATFAQSKGKTFVQTQPNNANADTAIFMVPAIKTAKPKMLWHDVGTIPDDVKTALGGHAGKWTAELVEGATQDTKSVKKTKVTVALPENGSFPSGRICIEVVAAKSAGSCYPVNVAPVTSAEGATCAGRASLDVFA